MYFLIFAQALLLCFILWVLWPPFRTYFFSTDVDNISGPENASITRGNYDQLFDLNGWDFHQQIAEQFGRVVRLYGAYGSKHLYIFDPKALHHIIVKDQAIFQRTTGDLTSNRAIFGVGLLSTIGDRHKKQRKMMNPVFSIAHMRNMIPLFSDVAQKMEETLRSKVINGVQEIDILHWMSRAALEMIGRSGFGYSFDSLVEGAPQHPFCAAAKSLVPALSKMAFEREYLMQMIANIGTPGFRRFLVDRFSPSQNLRDLRDIVNTLDRVTIEIYQGKKKALEEGDEDSVKQFKQAKDIMSILMKANLEATEEDKLPEEEVLGQMLTFCFAATDTTSNALSRTLHLLSMHPKIQDRLREELLEARSFHGEISYDDLVSLPYLDAVCRETLRLYPPVSFIKRTTRKDTVLPLSTPVKGIDGREMSSIVIPNKTKIFISIYNANRDPTLWGEDVLEWKPERWLSPLPQEVHDAHMPGIYSHLMTFSGGGRACIGFKFSQLEMKAILATLISSFRFSLPKEEIVWRMTQISTPTVKGSSGEPRLPLRLELV